MPRKWEVATRILFWHAVGLWICAERYRGPGTLMLISTLIFCGSVFALSLGAPGFFGLHAHGNPELRCFHGGVFQVA